MIPTLEPLVIYHGNCPDGFAAAWVAARTVPRTRRPGTTDVVLLPAAYGDLPPLEMAAGRTVFVLDFSYPRAQLEALHAVCDGNLVVLDHHKTAEADLAGLPYCQFDMHRSGARLAWDFFHSNAPAPWIVSYVEDRDLWLHKLPNSDVISLRIRMQEHTLEAWDALSAMPLDQVINEGRGAKLFLDKYVESTKSELYAVTNIDGLGNHAVCVNASYMGVSDVLHAALDATGARMAIAWRIDRHGMLVGSIRSRKDFDCSVFALELGGGGHAQASGFALHQDHPVARRLIGAQ
jgi:oligoribonuclease NrnB/cAMP/cGMP phosphodiesterase (DHH superfamily)